MVIKPEHINQIVQSFDPSDRQDARTVLREASQFATFDNMQSIYSGIRKLALNKSTPHVLYSTGDDSLAANLIYLEKYLGYSHENRVPITGNVSSVKSPARAIVLLDERILHKMEIDPHFARSVAEQRCSLINPRGYTTGFNPWNTISLEEMGQKTARILIDAKKVADSSGPGVEFAGAIRTALDNPLMDRLARIEARHQIPDGGLARLVQNMGYDHGGTSDRALASRFNDNRGLSGWRLGLSLFWLPSGYKQLALELLAQQAQVFSPRSLSTLARKQEEQINRLADKKGIPRENIYYWLPSPSKSFGMVAMIYSSVNGLGKDKILTPGDPRVSKLPKNSMLVVLDDIAGGGSTLQGAADTIRRNRESQYEIVIAPLASTYASLKLFKNLCSKDPTLNFLPARVIPEYNHTRLHNGLDQHSADAMLKLLNGTGLTGTGVSFPYMSPDNNTTFFAAMIARHFSWCEGSIKSNRPYYPPSTRDVRESVHYSIQSTIAEIASISTSSSEPDTGQGLERLVEASKRIDQLQGVGIRFAIGTRELIERANADLVEKLLVEIPREVDRLSEAVDRDALSVEEAISSGRSLDRLQTGLSRVEERWNGEIGNYEKIPELQDRFVARAQNILRERIGEIVIRTGEAPLAPAELKGAVAELDLLWTLNQVADFPEGVNYDLLLRSCRDAGTKGVRIEIDELQRQYGNLTGSEESGALRELLKRTEATLAILDEMRTPRFSIIDGFSKFHAQLTEIRRGLLESARSAGN
jgi:hypothetical protein